MRQLGYETRDSELHFSATAGNVGGVFDWLHWPYLLHRAGNKIFILPPPPSQTHFSCNCGQRWRCSWPATLTIPLAPGRKYDLYSPSLPPLKLIFSATAGNVRGVADWLHWPSMDSYEYRSPWTKPLAPGRKVKIFLLESNSPTLPLIFLFSQYRDTKEYRRHCLKVFLHLREV